MNLIHCGLVTPYGNRSGSTLAQVMACCLMAPSHYLNHCWLIISEVSVIHIRATSREMPQPSVTKICLKITYLKFHSNFPGANELICNVSSDITLLTHWGRVTHIYVSRLTITGSGNSLSPGRRQAIIWTNAGIWFIGLLGTNSSEILIKILTFSFQKIRLKVSSGKWQPFCLGLNVLRLLPHLSSVKS